MGIGLVSKSQQFKIDPDVSAELKDLGADAKLLDKATLPLSFSNTGVILIGTPENPLQLVRADSLPPGLQRLFENRLIGLATGEERVGLDKIHTNFRKAIELGDREGGNASFKTELFGNVSLSLGRGKGNDDINVIFREKGKDTDTTILLASGGYFPLAHQRSPIAIEALREINKALLDSVAPKNPQ